MRKISYKLFSAIVLKIYKPMIMNQTPKLSFFKKILSVTLCCLPLTAELASAKSLIAVYDLSGEVNETGQSESSFSLTPGRPLSHLELILSLADAAKSKEVQAIMVDADQAGLDLSQAQEIHRLLLAARESGKEVWVYSEDYSVKSALIGSAATKFTLMPESGVSFRGLYAESYYFKDLLDRLGLEAQVIHIGDYKSAGEELYRNAPSPEAAAQEEKLMDSIYNNILEHIAAGRSVEKAEVEAMLALPNPKPDDLLKAKLVDELSYRTLFVKQAKDRYGYEIEFDRYYHLPDTDGAEIKGIMDLMKEVMKASKEKKLEEDYIAVVPMEGTITDQSITQARSAILRAANNKYCKALVLRVDSPGGSALASDVLWEATNHWKESGRPMVVSMGGVAASGGYYISAGADQIFAEQGTITGSIGVVGMKLVAAKAMEKLGVHTHSIQRGKYAGVMSPAKAFNEEEASLIRDSMADVYEVFLRRVSQGRGEKIQGDLKDLAGGRIYSGADALKIGLVDSIGGLNDAIDWATKEAGLTKPVIQLSPQPRDGLEAILKPVPDRQPGDEFISMEKPADRSKQLRQALIDSGLPVVSDNKALDQFFMQMESIDSGHAQLLSPQISIPIN